jgi:DNA-binding transcriptional MerR regulator
VHSSSYRGPVPPTQSINAAARACGLTVYTLRWYERIGLLDRVPRGPDGRRRFGEPELSWLTFLVRLRSTGMPVADMVRYAELVRAGEHTEAERARMLVEHRERVRERITEQQAHLAALDVKIAMYRRDRRRLEETA